MFWDDLKAVLNSFNITIRFDITNVLFGILECCEKVMQVIFNEIPGFSRQFRLKRYFADFSPQFRDAYCFNPRDFSNDNSLFPKTHG